MRYELIAPSGRCAAEAEDLEGIRLGAETVLREEGYRGLRLVEVTATHEIHRGTYVLDQGALVLRGSTLARTAVNARSWEHAGRWDARHGLMPMEPRRVPRGFQPVSGARGRTNTYTDEERHEDDR